MCVQARAVAEYMILKIVKKNTSVLTSASAITIGSSVKLIISPLAPSSKRPYDFALRRLYSARKKHQLVR